MLSSRGTWAIEKRRNALRAPQGVGEERLEVRRLDLVAAQHLLDEEQAVGGDRDLVGAALGGALQREQKRPVLGDVVGLVPERLEVLLGREILLGGYVDARAGRSGIAARGPVDERPEAHEPRDRHELCGS